MGLPNDVVHVYQSIYEKKIEFFDGFFFANLRPLYDSNLAKVTIVKWSQSWIFVVKNVISGILFFWIIAVFNVILKS